MPVPRTPQDMNRLNAARAAGLVMPGGGERQEELASLPGQTPATPSNIPAGFTLADIQRMMSDPNRYGRINAPAKQSAAAPTKASKGSTRGTKGAPTPKGPPGTPRGPLQTVELPEPGLSSSWLPSLLMGGAGAGAAALAKYLMSRNKGTPPPAGTVGEEDVARAVTGFTGGENTIQDAAWSLAKDLPPPVKRLPAPPAALTDANGIPVGGNPAPEVDTPLQMSVTPKAAVPAGSTQDLLNQVIAESGVKPVATPKKKRTPEKVEEAAGRRRIRSPDAPSGRIQERAKVKGIKVKA